MSYWDTSALAKLYLVEPDSATFDVLAQRPTPIRISPLVRYEARLAFLRREREGAIAANAAVVLSRRLDQDIAVGKVEIVATGFAVESEFERVVQACLKGSDAAGVTAEPSKESKPKRRFFPRLFR